MSENEKNKPQGIYKYYENNPKSADEKVFGRVSYPDRRGFLKGAGLATMAPRLVALSHFTVICRLASSPQLLQRVLMTS